MPQYSDSFHCGTHGVTRYPITHKPRKGPILCARVAEGNCSSIFPPELAQAIEAQRAETGNTDSVHESAVPKGNAP